MAVKFKKPGSKKQPLPNLVPGNETTTTTAHSDCFSSQCHEDDFFAGTAHLLSSFENVKVGASFVWWQSESAETEKVSFKKRNPFSGTSSPFPRGVYLHARCGSLDMSIPICPLPHWKCHSQFHANRFIVV